MRLQERLFRVVLRLYPSEFRDRFGSDMAAAYREARMDAAMRGRRGWRSSGLVWRRMRWCAHRESTCE